MLHKSIITVLAALTLSMVSCKKEPSDIPVTGIRVTPETIEMEIGEQKAVTATVTPNDATNKKIVFSSSRETVATVSQDGIVEAVAAGKAIVTATSEDGEYRAHCNVTVSDPTPTPKPEPSPTPEQSAAVTGAATHISCRNAEISGRANPEMPVASDLAIGVQYGTSAEFPDGKTTRLSARAHDSEYNFGINTEVLEPETTYYFRTFVTQNGKIAYGDVKSFKTLPLSSMIQTGDATEISSVSAMMNASLDLSDCKFDGLEYGFEVTPDGKNAYVIKASNHSQKKFSARDASLSSGTKYSFAAFVSLDGRTYKGDAKTFATSAISASITAEASNVKYHSATVSGNLSVATAGEFGKTASVYYSSTGNTLEAMKTSGGNQPVELGKDGSFSVVLNALASDTRYSYCVVATLGGAEFVSEIKELTTAKVPEGAIDLGLSVVWASCNIGAASPEQIGDLFAWGETIAKDHYWPQTYTLYKGEMLDSGYELESINKYNLDPSTGEVDGKIVLDPEDDIAHVKMGGSWRMPTKTEMDELLENCTSEWTTVNDVKGYKLTSKLEGFTDRWIFLPAAGMNGGTRGFVNELGYYWSSSLCPYDGNVSLKAYLIQFSSSNIYLSIHPRYYGFSVRAVAQ